MKLYYFTGACSLSPHIALLEAGLPFTLVKIDSKTKKTESGADYLAVNSKGAVPALELDDGRVLTEGPAIVQYIADLKPDSGLAPRAGTFERYQLMEILNFITSEVHKSFSPLFNPASTPETKEAFGVQGPHREEAEGSRSDEGRRPDQVTANGYCRAIEPQPRPVRLRLRQTAAPPGGRRAGCSPTIRHACPPRFCGRSPSPRCDRL
jgi:glutathione S-transferase